MVLSFLNISDRLLAKVHLQYPEALPFSRTMPRQYILPFLAVIGEG